MEQRRETHENFRRDVVQQFDGPPSCRAGLGYERLLVSGGEIPCDVLQDRLAFCQDSSRLEVNRGNFAFRFEERVALWLQADDVHFLRAVRGTFGLPEALGYTGFVTGDVDC